MYLTHFGAGHNSLLLNQFTGERQRTREIKFNPFPNKLLFLLVCSTSLFENTVGKGEIARNEQFFLFLQCFLAFWILLENYLRFSSTLKLASANAFCLEESKAYRLKKGLNKWS